MNDLLKKEIELLVDLPGCYQMFDKNNTIIYIGKAKNLKKRVSQYFFREQTGKTAVMVSNVDHFETIITDSEKEALILEMNLIQKYHPRYNILLMDDKHYPYIEVHKGIKHPYVSIARNVKNKKSSYFGPYPSSSSAFEVINIINSNFPLRKCNNVPKNTCLYYHMHQCLAPCINEISTGTYDDIISKIESFLKGNNEEMILKLKKKIEECSENLKFEDALEYRKQLDSILYINQKQNVEFLDKIDRDFISFYTNESFVSIIILIYRNGLLVGQKKFFYEYIGELYEFIADLLVQYYSINTIPNHIVISSQEIYSILNKYLEITILIPKQGKMLDIISIANQNAKDYMSSYIQTYKSNESEIELLDQLAKLLKIERADYIELFDNSHLQGSNAVGAMVAFINGVQVKKMSRKFNIESFNKKDDISSMKEVVYRRYSRLLKDNARMPDLIIVDGGENQIKATLESLRRLNLNINVAGLVKNDKHQTRALMTSNFEEIEIKDKELFIFLSKMQDSIHRFAIETHIGKRNKSMFNSIFDNIDGIGSKRKELLVKQYPTLTYLSSATIEELCQYIPYKSAVLLKEKLKDIGDN